MIQSGLDGRNQSQDESKNRFNSRLKGIKELMSLIRSGRPFHSLTHEKANAEGALDRDFGTWKFEELPRVL